MARGGARVTAGRPATGRSTGVIAIRLPVEVVDRLKAQAENRGLSTSDYAARMFMRSYRWWFFHALVGRDDREAYLEARNARHREQSKWRAEATGRVYRPLTPEQLVSVRRRPQNACGHFISAPDKPGGRNGGT